MNKQNSKAPVGSGALLAGNILITGDPAIGKTTLACRIKAGIQALEPSHRVEVVNDAPGNITRVGIQMLQNANDTLIFVCYRNRDVRKLRRWGFKWRVLVPMHLKANEKGQR